MSESRFTEMRRIGRIEGLWRYPVSALGGQSCDRVAALDKGLFGDRQFGLFDAMDGSVAAPDKEPRWRPALFLSSRIVENNDTLVRFPDGAELHVSDHGIGARLSEHFGFAVSIGRYADIPTEAARWLPVISRPYALSPLHLVTTSSLQSLQSHLASNEADARRFRPSVLLATEESDGFVEDDWIGAILHIGKIRAIVIERTKRCGMTLAAQPGLAEQPDVLRAILRNNHRCLGVYCDVVEPGLLEVGDEVFIRR